MECTRQFKVLGILDELSANMGLIDTGCAVINRSISKAQDHLMEVQHVVSGHKSALPVDALVRLREYESFVKQRHTADHWYTRPRNQAWVAKAVAQRAYRELLKFAYDGGTVECVSKEYVRVLAGFLHAIANYIEHVN